MKRYYFNFENKLFYTMSLIPHNFFPRSMFDVDKWFHPKHPTTTLDLFDPFDELDQMIGHNLEWLNKPDLISNMPMIPKVPQKYRISIDCSGFNPKSIKTDLNGHMLTVSAHKEEITGENDSSSKEFVKTYEIPEKAELNKIVSFMTRGGHLIIEFPLRETRVHQNNDLFPNIVDTDNGNKAVSFNFNVPNKIDPSKISINIKDHDMIVKAEDKVENPDGVTRYYYYKRTTMPENTDFDALKCSYDHHRIHIDAPLKPKTFKSVPIEFKKQDAIESASSAQKAIKR